MSATSVLNQLCVYFGGPYDAGTHTYRTPQITVPGMAVGVIRRAWAKRDDHADYYLGATGIFTGCQIVVQLDSGRESRAAVGGATSGLKHVQHDVEMHCFIRSSASYAEDTQDSTYALLDAIRARIEADRTCGSGGFEAGVGVGFQVGEGGAPHLQWHTSAGRSSAEETKAYLNIHFAADEYVMA